MWDGSSCYSQGSGPSCTKSQATWKQCEEVTPSGKLKLTLTVSMLILMTSGCAGLSSKQIPQPIPRPTLESLQESPDGGICMDKQDSAELLLYIDALERRP